ncbi:MAG: subclass B3 metallo-beta-lactamase [Hyphomonadaceae bacterium]|nr:subclass B3 metallo-beta-lactamase [Hyphomonadaceae bacterium]
MTIKAAAMAMLLAACAAAPQRESMTADASETPPPAILLQTPGVDRNIGLRMQVDAWRRPVEPFTILGNVHYVGAEGVSAFLITTPQGHILLDGGVAEMAAPIAANIAALGHDVRNVRYLLNSHAHFDHAGGLAALQMQTGATFVASEADRATLESGHIGYGPAAEIDFAPIRVDRVIADGETIELGGVRMTAHMTPGHTRGCTSWRTVTRDAHGAERSVFFHCSATVAGQSLAPEAYPGIVADFRRSFTEIVPAITADVFLSNHGQFFDLAGKRARQRAGDANAFVDPGELQRFNATMQAAF